MRLVRWTCFTWDLGQLPAGEPLLGPALRVRSAERDELPQARAVVVSSLALDSAWNDVLKLVRADLDAHIDQVAEHGGIALVLTHGVRIIGASFADAAAECASHLVSGPCVLPEYHSRGLGTALLLATLRGLRASGLKRARGVTKDHSPASRFVYPKFGGTAAAVDFFPAAPAFNPP
jgi:GNAT superfamily N-acetyltransferase